VAGFTTLAELAGFFAAETFLDIARFGVARFAAGRAAAGLRAVAVRRAEPRATDFRATDFRAGALRAGALRAAALRAVVRVAVVFRALVPLAGVFRAVVRLAVVVRAVLRLTVDLRAGDFRAGDFRTGDFRAVVFLTPLADAPAALRAGLRAVVFLALVVFTLARTAPARFVVLALRAPPLRPVVRFVPLVLVAMASAPLLFDCRTRPLHRTRTCTNLRFLVQACRPDGLVNCFFHYTLIASESGNCRAVLRDASLTTSRARIRLHRLAQRRSRSDQSQKRCPAVRSHPVAPELRSPGAALLRRAPLPTIVMPQYGQYDTLC
jgi:hypothetical protein